jgi:hypothetical protein
VEEKRTWRVRPCLGRRLLAFELEPRPELEPRDGAAALRTERTEAMTNPTPVAVTWGGAARSPRPRRELQEDTRSASRGLE